MSEGDNDLARLRRAVGLARQGRFAVEPNPLVGCVLEKDGKVVGEGWHAAYGGPHAEVAALALAGEAARGSTAYVTLEPCAGTAKKTPPCVDALVRAGVARVVYAAADPDPANRGGAARLAAAGVSVTGPVPGAEAETLLAEFRRAMASDRPWTIAKWAMSWDGRTSPAKGAGGRLVGDRALAFVHDLRGRTEAIVVGVGTVLSDDPRLTCRLDGGPPDARSQPLRVVLDSTLRTPPTARLLREGPPGTVIAAASSDPARRKALESAGAEVWSHPAPGGTVDVGAVLRRLRRERGVRRVLVEGGSRVQGTLFREGLVDQVVAIVTPRVLGDAGAPVPVEGSGFGALGHAPVLDQPSWRPFGADLVLRAYVPPGKRVPSG